MDLYTSFLSDSDGKELEYRIPIDKTQYDSILRFLTNSAGQEEPLSISLNILMAKNIRMSIQGSRQIEHFCARDFIPVQDWSSVTLGIKKQEKIVKNPNGSRITLSREKEDNFQTLALNPDMLRDVDPNVKSIVQESQLAGNNKINLLMYQKIFRLRKRHSFVFGDQFRVDLTMVKKTPSVISLSDRRRDQTALTMKEAELGKQPLVYELEVELLKADPVAVSNMQNMIEGIETELQLKEETMPKSAQSFYRMALKSMIESHFTFLQEQEGGVPEGSPKSITEAVKQYASAKKLPYCIPKLVSMTRADIPIPHPGMAMTDKADGDSCMVMVVQKRVYVFDSGFRMLTPVRTLGSDFPFDTICLFAGEFLQKDKSGLPHSTAYLYDAYLWDAKDVRRLNLVSEKEDEPTRIRIVREFCDQVQEGEPVIGEGIRVRAKEMILGDPKEVSEAIWKRRNSYPYVLDGIIFTPAYVPVGASEKNPWEWGYRMDRTWHTNYKWKPPAFNSVDFLLVWTSGITKGAKGLVRKGELRTTESIEVNGIRSTVFPLFQPKEYVKPKAYQVEVPVDVSREPKTEEDGEYIRNYSIVECRYDMDQRSWIVLRNRSDKTKAWDASRESLEGTRSKINQLVAFATQKRRSGDWKQIVLRNIDIAGGVRVADQKLRKFNALRADLIRFLRFHSMIPTMEIDDKELVAACNIHSERITTLLGDTFVPIPLPYGLSGSNHTFVANTIWKSIHEPVQIEDLNRTPVAAAEAATDDATAEGASGGAATVAVTGKKAFAQLPIQPDVNVELMEVLEDMCADAKSEHLLEISDHEVPLRKESMLWTSRVSARKTSTLIRGDARKFKTGWLNKDDKKTWQDWKESTGGATHVILMGIPGSLENVRQRKGLIESVTQSATEGSLLYLVYWDHSKIASLKTGGWTTVTAGDRSVEAKKTRSGHLVIRVKEGEEYSLYAWSETKFLGEYAAAGWKLDASEAMLGGFEAVSKKDPITSFLSLKVMKKE